MKSYYIALFVALAPLAARAQGMDILCKSVSGDAAYRPGMDAHGRAVASIETDGHLNLTPDVYTIPLTIDMAERMQLPAGTDPYVDLGTIQVTKAGHATYNGRDITQQSRTACGNDGAPIPLVKNDAATAQPPAKTMSFSQRERGPMLRREDAGEPEDTPHDNKDAP